MYIFINARTQSIRLFSIFQGSICQSTWQHPKSLHCTAKLSLIFTLQIVACASICLKIENKGEGGQSWQWTKKAFDLYFMADWEIIYSCCNLIFLTGLISVNTLSHKTANKLLSCVSSVSFPVLVEATFQNVHRAYHTTVFPFAKIGCGRSGNLRQVTQQGQLQDQSDQNNHWYS